MDELEKFIVNHRQEFNTETPSDKVWLSMQSRLEEGDWKVAMRISEEANPAPSNNVWAGIEQQLNTEGMTKPKAKDVKMVPLKRLWQMAASFAILLVATLYLQHYLQTESTNGSLVAEQSQEKPIDALATMAPELLEAEQYYMSVIQQQETALKGYASYGPDHQHFDEDMTQLDSAYQEMKKDLAIQPDNERVVNAMIENLQLRMTILSKQLQLMEQLKQIKEGSRDQVDFSVFES